MKTEHNPILVRAIDGTQGDKPRDADPSRIEVTETPNDTPTQTIEKSGGVDRANPASDPLNVMNPYQTINYLIYTGVVA